MIKKMVLLLVVLTLSVPACWSMGEITRRAMPANPTVLLARIESKIRAAKIMSDSDLRKLIQDLRKEYESRKNIDLKDYTLEERTQLMLKESIIVSAVKLAAKSKMAVREQARIALAVSVGTAKGASEVMLRAMIQTMVRERVRAGVCVRVIYAAAEEGMKNPNMTETRDLISEMIKLRLKGEGLAQAAKLMNHLIKAGSTPKEAKLEVMKQIKLMQKEKKNEAHIAKQLQLRIK